MRAIITRCNSLEQTRWCYFHIYFTYLPLLVLQMRQQCSNSRPCLGRKFETHTMLRPTQMNQYGQKLKVRKFLSRSDYIIKIDPIKKDNHQEYISENTDCYLFKFTKNLERYKNR